MSLVILEIDMVILHLNVFIFGCEEDFLKKQPSSHLKQKVMLGLLCCKIQQCTVVFSDGIN